MNASRTALLLALVIALPRNVVADTAAAEPDRVSKDVERTVAAADLAWTPGPPSLPAGVQVAVLAGDPAQPGPFVMRLKIPDGSSVGRHVHPASENVTVLSGTFVLGLSDGTKQRLSSGGFFVMPAGVPHSGAAQGETVIEIHATGPWGLTYENPKDDPQAVAKH